MIAVALALAFSGASAAAVPRDSGVVGVVRAASSGGQAVVEVRRVQGGAVVASRRVGPGGRFRFALPPGRYAVRLVVAGRLAAARPAAVRPHAFTLVVLAAAPRPLPR